LTIRDTYNTSVSNNHASAEVGGITFCTSATVATVRNQSTWSRASARVALANGDITAAQFVYLMQSISGWEQAQNSSAKATLRKWRRLFPSVSDGDVFLTIRQWRCAWRSEPRHQSADHHLIAEARGYLSDPTT
jgi:hypothetical protein